MAEQKECQCQSTAHGHRSGKCHQPAVDDGLCMECNEETRAAEANPYGTRDSTASRGSGAHRRLAVQPLRPSGLRSVVRLDGLNLPAALRHNAVALIAARC